MAAISSRDYSATHRDRNPDGPVGCEHVRLPGPGAGGAKPRRCPDVWLFVLGCDLEKATFAQTRVPPGENGQREVYGIIWAFKIGGYRDDTRQSTAR